MNPLELVKLTSLMARSRGSSDVLIGLIDGPVAATHPDLTAESIREVPGSLSHACRINDSHACGHGTFVAGILAARRGTGAPGICPACTLLVRPIFPESNGSAVGMPSATPEHLATAISEIVNAGARVINISAALANASPKGEREISKALDAAAARGAIVIAAAGNQGIVGSSVLIRHPWVIAVTACDLAGRPTGQANMGRSIGTRGLAAPGEAITSLGASGPPVISGGTSAAAPFVTGATALLWSEFPRARAEDVKLAVCRPDARRREIFPPLLNAEAAYQLIRSRVN